MSELTDRLRVKAFGLECAADAEQLVIDGLLQFRAEFRNGDKSNYVMHRLRVLLDAENNLRSFTEDVKDLRTAADMLDEMEVTTDD